MDVFEHWPVEMVELSKIEPHPENYREHDVGAIAHSIKLWGVWRPMVVQESTNYVIVGNGELKALQALGETVGPVRWMDVDDANARAILLADNWIPSRGRNMPDELLEVMRELREDAELFEATGADDDDVEALERDLADLDKPLKLDVKPKMRKITCPECSHTFEVKR